MRINIRQIESMPFAENSYVVWTTGPEAVVVDPGFEPELILDFLNEQKLHLVAIINTHGHVDHIAGNAAMKEAYPDAPIIIGRGDALMLTDANLNLSEPFGVPVISPPADRLLDEHDEVAFAGMAWDVLNLPGHSPGHVVYIIRNSQPLHILGGDVLFEGSIGRTDFPGGSQRQLIQGIRDKLFVLADDAKVFPGHGSPTTIGHEKRTNPFLQNG